jgi:hypothetical protein
MLQYSPWPGILLYVINPVLIFRCWQYRSLCLPLHLGKQSNRSNIMKAEERERTLGDRLRHGRGKVRLFRASAVLACLDAQGKIRPFNMKPEVLPNDAGIYKFSSCRNESSLQKPISK